MFLWGAQHFDHLFTDLNVHHVHVSRLCWLDLRQGRCQSLLQATKVH